MFEESTSLLVAAGPESTSRLRSTTQLRRGDKAAWEMLCAILKCVDLILYILYSNMTLSFSVKSVGCLTKLCLN